MTATACKRDYVRMRWKEALSHAPSHFVPDQPMNWALPCTDSHFPGGQGSIREGINPGSTAGNPAKLNFGRGRERDPCFNMGGSTRHGAFSVVTECRWAVMECIWAKSKAEKRHPAQATTGYAIVNGTVPSLSPPPRILSSHTESHSLPAHCQCICKTVQCTSSLF